MIAPINSVIDKSTTPLTNPPIYAKPVKNGIFINFSSVLGEKDIIDDLSFYSLSKKRNYTTPSVIEKVVNTLNVVFESIPEYDLYYFEMTCHIYKSETEADAIKTTAEFKDYVVKLFDNEEVIKLFKDRTIERYPNIERAIEGRRQNENDDLQFSEEQDKLILIWSEAITLAIPLILLFADVRDFKLKTTIALLVDCFSAILKKFEESEESNILAKIERLFEGKINRTAHSDRPMWNYLKSIPITMTSFTRDVYRRFIVDVLPKLDQQKSSIFLLQTVPIQQIAYLFRRNDTIEYNPIVTTDPFDSGRSGQLERLDAILSMIDEGQAIIRKINGQDSLVRLSRDLGVNPQSLAIDHLASQLKLRGINNWQIHLVSLILYPSTRSVDITRTYDLNQFAFAMFIASKWLEINNLTCLRDYLLSYHKNRKSKSEAGGKILLKAQIESRAYEMLMKRSYTMAQQLLIDNSVILDLITPLNQGVFLSLPNPFGEEKDHKGNEIIQHNVSNVTQEVLDLLLTITNKTR